MGIESKARHQGDYSASQRPLCSYAQVLPDFVTALVVLSPDGEEIARTRDLERGQVREELHRLQGLFPRAEGYAVRAIVTEVKAE